MSGTTVRTEKVPDAEMGEPVMETEDTAMETDEPIPQVPTPPPTPPLPPRFTTLRACVDKALSLRMVGEDFDWVNAALCDSQQSH